MSVEWVLYLIATILLVITAFNWPARLTKTVGLGWFALGLAVFTFGVLPGF